ncbi:helix-turn-helix transcriptional regulator [Actinoplanes sp. NPDC048796]|uniref:helix-turn-helix transcriptional regulator n=1 Tax=Actinoplanes sp. NPDC048796 TaxID=3155640 RepID=UPI0033C65923
MADRARMSRATFARRFAGPIGQPPVRYFTWWRLTTAARLLRTSDAPLDAIAAGVGYTSTFAFSNAFKRRFDMAPGQYRRAGADPRPGRDHHPHPD